MGSALKANGELKQGARNDATASSAGKAMQMRSGEQLNKAFDWEKVAHTFLTSRLIDDVEEQELYAQKKIAYQFSARGHTLSQVLLGNLLSKPQDGASAYYRSRPLLLSVGLSVADAFAGPLGKSGGYSDGRDIGVVCNLISTGAATVLPMAGDVGSQYTPAAGWAEAIKYHRDVLKNDSYSQAIAVAHGGEGSIATNGFWSALNIVTTQRLPLLFFIEDNHYAISVPRDKQTPGGNIADNLAAFGNLQIFQGDGADPVDAAEQIAKAVECTRAGNGPALIRLDVPRLCGHSGQDTQGYKSEDLIAKETERDPLPRLKNHLVPALYSEAQWTELNLKIESEVRAGLKIALERPDPDPSTIEQFNFSEKNASGDIVYQTQGGLPANTVDFPETTQTLSTEGARINMLEGVRQTLDTELSINPRLVVFGEDVGPKGGVHTATMGLQKKYGEQRVYDTSLSEEGIIGRSVGMALSGLTPVPEIQFRKYADAGTEQLNNCGTIRWRTKNKFAAPVVVRMPAGHSRRCGDPWHSVSGEAIWAHQVGWQVVMPSNTADAVGLLRTAIRGNDPVIFLEHRALLDDTDARRPYPGDNYAIPFGQARVVTEGTDLSVITWGAMLQNSLDAAEKISGSIEVIDLRTICPWDRQTVFDSVRKTKRCLIVHEDTMTVGFGAEIASQLVGEMFFELDAPVKRVAPSDIPIPYTPLLMNSVIPSVERIAAEMQQLIEF